MLAYIEVILTSSSLQPKWLWKPHPAHVIQHTKVLKAQFVPKKCHMKNFLKGDFEL